MNYSTFKDWAWIAFKNQNRKRDKCTFLSWQIKMFNKEKGSFLFTTACYCYRYAKCCHLYLDEGIYDFCKNAVVLSEESLIKAFPENFTVSSSNNLLKEIGVLAEYDISSLDGKERDVCIPGFFVHFPISEKRTSLLIFSSDILKGLYSVNDGESHVFSKGNIDDEYIKFAYGLSLYIDAFPETVKEHFISGIDNKLVRKITISKSQIVSSEANKAISPHYRRGHLRMLNSERFIKKRGMTVWVEGSFVKGHAYDVCNEEQSNPAFAA